MDILLAANRAPLREVPQHSHLRSVSTCDQSAQETVDSRSVIQARLKAAEGSETIINPAGLLAKRASAFSPP
jgi:hypothetical protein